MSGAWFGYGVWALVASHLAMKLVRVFLTRAAVTIPHGGAFTRSSASALLSKGVGFSVGRILNFISLQGDNFVVGRLLGTEVLGMYSRAYQLMAIPAMLVGQLFERVLFPALAQKQHDLSSMRRAFQASLEVCTIVALPVSVFLFFLSREIIQILFGARWLGIAPVLSVLSLAVFFRTTYKCGDTVVRSKGEMVSYTTRQVWYTAIVFFGSWIGALVAGTIGVAWAVVMGIVVNYVLMTHLAARLIELPFSALVRAHLPGIWIALCAAITVLWIAPIARAWELGPVFVIGAVGFTFLGVLGVSLVLGWGLVKNTSLFALVPQMRRSVS
jgi:PST family polysaccharide transporter